MPAALDGDGVGFGVGLGGKVVTGGEEHVKPGEVVMVGVGVGGLAGDICV